MATRSRDANREFPADTPGAAAPGPLSTEAPPSDASRSTGPSGFRGAALPLLGGLAVCGCGVALAIWNPTDTGTPFCPTKAITGIDCPLCGGLRAVAALTRGNLRLAADHNLLLTLLAPVVVVWWAMWVVNSWRGEPAPPNPLWNRMVFWSILVIALVFTVVRNLPVAGAPHWLAASRA